MMKSTILKIVGAVLLAVVPLRASPARVLGADRPMMKPKEIAALKAELVEQHGEASRARVERGVDQVAALWRKPDGSVAEWKAFAREHFVPAGKDLDRLFERFEANFEQLDGHLLEIARELRRPS